MTSHASHLNSAPGEVFELYMGYFVRIIVVFGIDVLQLG